MANGSKRGELIILRDGQPQPGAVMRANSGLNDLLVDHSVEEDRLTLRLQQALSHRRQKLEMAVSRLEAWNDELDQRLAEEFSTE